MADSKKHQKIKYEFRALDAYLISSVNNLKTILNDIHIRSEPLSNEQAFN